MLGFAAAAVVMCAAFLEPHRQDITESEAPVTDCIQNPSRAAVVFTGTSLRVRTGLQLYADRKVCWLLISGLKADQSLAEVIARSGIPVPSVDHIMTDPSVDTYHNAHSSAAWIAGHPEVTDVILVTSSLHMARSVILMERAIKHSAMDVHLITLPVADLAFDLKEPFSLASSDYLHFWGLERFKLLATLSGWSTRHEDISSANQISLSIKGLPYPKSGQKHDITDSCPLTLN